MSESFTTRISKINSLKKRLRLNTDQLAALTDPRIEPREIEQLLADTNSIYRDEQTVAILEKAILKAHTQANDSLNVKGSDPHS
jgi:hypothetical protein